jgi:hypothetical protein
VVRQAVTELVEVHQPLVEVHQPPVAGKKTTDNAEKTWKDTISK